MANTSKSISDFRQKTEQETSRLNTAISLRKVDLSRFSRLKTEGASLGKGFREASARTTELGKRLAAMRAQARDIPALGGKVKRLTAEFGKSKRETELLRQKWQSATSGANNLRDTLRRIADEHKKNKEAIKRHRDELVRLSAVEEGETRMKAGRMELAKGAAAITATTMTLRAPECMTG
ncbi:MAG: hypothetical protein LBI87_11025 [Candidatus Accumulibacter sp.]|nr:hypothetical protein [Accumulibacter sp.]